MEPFQGADDKLLGDAAERGSTKPGMGTREEFTGEC
jgi:hypothetical protein